MNKSVKWSRFFESFIYFILLTIPLISVFARVIYVQSNNNAKDSYSGSGVALRTTKVDASGALVNGYTYDFYLDLDIGVNSSTSVHIKYSSISIDWVTFGAPSSYNYDGFYLYKVSNSQFYLYLEENGTTVYTFWGGVQTFGRNLSFGFVSATTVSLNGNQCFNLYFSTYAINSIDNAFDFGIQKTLDDFGQGNINFLNWFGTMFSNNNNLLYINFVNMYLNYALWVSVGYLIYYFLVFFVKIIRNLVDSFIRKGESW